jgi:pyrimidine and pyridine-specific 5'-nucleotidase
LVSLCKKLRAQKHMKIYIFTNSDIEHCRRVLNRLGLSESLFDGLICFDSPGIDCKFCKPQRIMYEYAMKVAGIKDPSKCIFC